MVHLSSQRRETVSPRLLGCLRDRGRPPLLLLGIMVRYVCVYACLCVCLSVCVHLCVWSMFVCSGVCVFGCFRDLCFVTCVCTCVYVHTFVCVFRMCVQVCLMWMVLLSLQRREKVLARLPGSLKDRGRPPLLPLGIMVSYVCVCVSVVACLSVCVCTCVMCVKGGHSHTRRINS